MEGHLSVVQLLVEMGADINVKNGEGWTPLHWAAWASDLSVVKLLVKSGADVNGRLNLISLRCILPQLMGICQW